MRYLRCQSYSLRGLIDRCDRLESLINSTSGWTIMMRYEIGKFSGDGYVYLLHQCVHKNDIEYFSTFGGVSVKLKKHANAV